MNIFATSRDPVMCAVVLDDARVNKMCLETAQMICTAMPKLSAYKPTHNGHEITKWAMKEDNLPWVVQHHAALAAEYSARTGRVHASWRDVGMKVFNGFMPIAQPLVFCRYAKNQARLLDFTTHETHHGYRIYLRVRWRTDTRPPVWTNRQPPDWQYDERVDLGKWGEYGDREKLLSRARSNIGSVRAGTWGEIPCPWCGSNMNWRCEEYDNYVIFRCEEQGCLKRTEVRRK